MTLSFRVEHGQVCQRLAIPQAMLQKPELRVLSVAIGALITTLNPLNAELEGVSGGLWGGAAYSGREVGR